MFHLNQSPYISFACPDAWQEATRTRPCRWVYTVIRPHIVPGFGSCFSASPDNSKSGTEKCFSSLLVVVVGNRMFERHFRLLVEFLHKIYRVI